MNRRLVLIDQDETKDFANYFCCGLGPEIYTLQSLNEKSPEELDNILNLGMGDAVMLVGGEPFKYLQGRYHYGIRKENYSDCAKLPRLSIEGGSFAKCVIDFPNQYTIDYFMSDKFVEHRDFSWFKQTIIHNYKDAISFLKWLDNQSKDTNYGFDYEASGMPLDRFFEISGASLCTKNYGAFISFTDIRHTATDREYADLLTCLGKFLLNRMNYVWTFNQQYEFQVSRRMLGVDLYNLRDASVFNILDGNHLKKYSLKWTANMILGSTVWDTEFDRISDLVDSMLFEEVGKLKRDKKKVLKVTKEDFKNTDEWKKLCKLYPNYIQEFESLILEYWGNPFMCIPSNILGYYCNLDAFYTLMIYETKKTEYSQKAIDTFSDNLRLAARLHSCGIPKWEDYRLEYEKYCREQMAWGITYCATARCMIKMKKHSKLMENLNKYNDYCKILLNKGEFFNGDTLNIAKYILANNVDEMDAYDTGVNEGSILMNYGEDFAEKFMEFVRSSMIEVKFKGKIDKTITRKKKILGVISEKLKPFLGLDNFKLTDKHIELEKYIYYNKAFDELTKISKTQLNNINNIPESIHGFGRTFNLLEYSDFVSDNFFKCKSPIENNEIAKEFTDIYKRETIFLASMLESTQQLKDAEDFYKSQGINSIEDGFAQFMQEWFLYYSKTKYNYNYPDKVFTLAMKFWNDPYCDEVKEIWTNMNGFIVQSQFFSDYKNQFKEYGECFNEEDLNKDFFFMRKMVLNYLIYKKYAKILSTYINGMFLQTDKYVIEDPNSHVTLREADPNEPGAITKMFPKFQCMEKSSKRWSSGYHTIISHSDIKSTIKCYPGHLLSYFDISSAEVKSAGFASGDPDLIDKFVNGVDIYVYTGKLYLPDGPWDTDPAFKKVWRKRFKTIFLGILYGLGKKSLAERLNCSEDEAENIIESVYKAFPKLREYIAEQQKYPFNHGGYINTFFGDKLKVDEWKYLEKASNQFEIKSLTSRIERLAVNLPIQGGTSTAMSSGFFNDLRVARESGWDLTSFITVHDSNTCDFPADKLWDIRKFYDHNFTDFCYDKTGIKLLFDLEVGSTYQDSCSMKQIDDNTIELTGNARSLQMIMDHMNECPGCNYEISMKREDIIPNFVTDPIDRFIREKGCSMVMDTSKYKVLFKRIL